MKNSNLWLVLGVIAAVVIAWFIVNAVFALIGFVFKLVVVVVVAAVVFFVLRAIFARSDAP